MVGSMISLINLYPRQLIYPLIILFSNKNCHSFLLTIFATAPSGSPWLTHLLNGRLLVIGTNGEDSGWYDFIRKKIGISFILKKCYRVLLNKFRHPPSLPASASPIIQLGSAVFR